MLRLKSKSRPDHSEGICLKRQCLLSAVKGDFLLWPPVLLKSVDRQLTKVENETVIEFWRLRIAEDVIKVVYHWGQIPDCSPFVVRTIHSWVRNSKAHFLVDLGKALAPKKRLSKVQTFPYVLMNRAYSTLTGCYPVENPLRRENEILLEISRLYGLTVDQVKEILFMRARIDPLEYVSPFKSTSAKKVRAREWKCWETFLDFKAKGARTDKEAVRLAAIRKGCSEEKVRKMIQQAKQILEVQHRVRVIKSDGDLSKIAEEHFMQWKSESLPKSLFPARGGFSLPDDTV
jgi:hypothetical protein